MNFIHDLSQFLAFFMKLKKVLKKIVNKISSPVFSSFIFLRRSCTLTCALIFQSGGLLLLLLTAAAEHSPLPDGSTGLSSSKAAPTQLAHSAGILRVEMVKGVKIF